MATDTQCDHENALEAYSRAYGLRSVSLRYFNAAGADESGEIGEIHEPETHLIPLALAASTENGPELQIHGSDYPTPDGTCLRDYIHVNDLADAHVRALQYLEKGGDSLAINLGTGRGHSVLEVIQAAENATGRPVRRKIGPRRPGYPPVLVADPVKAQTVLGWTAKRNLADIVSSAWTWMHLRGAHEPSPGRVRAVSGPKSLLWPRLHSPLIELSHHALGASCRALPSSPDAARR